MHHILRIKCFTNPQQGGGSCTRRTGLLSYKYYAGGGGSGSGFNCVLQLTAGNYAIAVGSGGTHLSGSVGTATGGGNSRFGTSYSYGGKGGQVTSSSASGGAGGGSPLITYTKVSTALNKAGNSGGVNTGSSSYKSVKGGSAVYSSYGKGGDSDSPTYNGTAGYVKVVYIGA